MKKIAEEWLLAAKDDLDVIVRIIDVAHLSHIVAFHAQQCIEKSFKALMEEHDLETPKIHNLVTIYGRLENLFPQRLDVQLLQTLDSLYIDARYPGELGLLPDGKPTIEDARNFYGTAVMIFEKIKNLDAYQER